MSKNRDKNRTRELEFLKGFIKAMNTPNISRYQLAIDPPDFILINEKDQVIGLELMELHSNEEQKATEEHFKTIIKNAEDEFAKLSDAKICVSFHFNEPVQSSKKKTQKIGESIARWLLKHLNEYCKFTGHSLPFENPIQEIKSLSKIELIKCDSCCKVGWKYDRGLVFGSECQPNFMFEAITKKSDLVPSWNENFIYIQKWLLLVETGENSSVFSSYPIEHMVNDRFNNFDRIFIFNDFMQKIVFCKDRLENNII